MVNSNPEEEEEDGEEDEGAGGGGAAQQAEDRSAKQKDPTRRRKINDFIADKTYRMRSFLRRRGVPLSRTTEMDIQGGLKISC